MDYRSYYYHGAKHITKPRKTNGNIKGLELETSDFDCGYLLDELIEEDIVTVPETESSDKTGLVIACEDDGSVYKELIFKASCNSTLLRGVKQLHDKLHYKVLNEHGTSCHIHINDAYLDKIGINTSDIIKSSEFIAPILYEISGRDYNSYKNWAKSIFENEISITNKDLLKRAELIEREGDNIDNYSARYSIINQRPEHTTELRIFSNYYNFDYNYIKMYLETTDFLIQLGEFMKDKNYVDEYNNVIELTKKFFGKRKYKKIFEEHELEDFFLSYEERKIKTLNKAIEYFKEKIEEYKAREFYVETDRLMSFIRLLRNFEARFSSLPEISFSLGNFNDSEIEENIIRLIENEINELKE